MRVVLYGGRHYNNVHLLYETLHQLREMGLTHLNGTTESGSMQTILRYASDVGIATSTFTAAWLLHGKEAETRLRSTMLDTTKPDMVVLLPGQYSDTQDMANICNAREIDVWDLRGLAWVDLGSGYQLGDEVSEACEPF